jgi:hypothetical protein
MLSTLRGGLLDLLATDDTSATDASMRLQLGLMAQAAVAD